MTVPRDWPALLALIPGYDSIATAGDCRFDIAAADHAVDFFHECLTHVKGKLAGHPLRLEPWQQAFIGCIFGWKRPDGTRRYREVLLYIPRKNGKTVIAAGIALYVLFCDNEPGAEIYSAGGDEEQAELAFKMAAQMVRNEPELAGRGKVFGGAITFESQGSSYKPITAKATTKHGMNIHLALIDELHAFPDRELVDVLVTATGAREQPLIIYTTTADFAGESICNEILDRGLKICEGVIEDRTFLPVIYCATIEDDWKSPDVWRKANPNLGVSVPLSYYETQCAKAQTTPAYENTFKRLHLNIVTEQATRWLAMDVWDASAGEVIPDADLAKRPCIGALDLSSTRDITALVLAFPLEEDRIYLRPFFWIPEENARAREKRDRVPYTEWARLGLIEMTPGNVIDYRYIIRRAVELKAQFDIQEIAYDPWNATQTAIELQDTHGMTMVEFRQGFLSMNEPTKHMETLIQSRKLLHQGNRVLRWMASNVTVRTDPAGNIKIDKEKSAEKVDGLVASAMAIGRIIAVKRDGPSTYESGGIEFV